MNEHLQKIDIKRFKSLFPSSLQAELGNDFFFANLELQKNNSRLAYPFRLDGYVAVYCLQGSMDVSINLNTFPLKENTVVLNVPGNIFQIQTLEETARIFIIAMSRDFFSSIYLDFNKMFNDSIALFSNPTVQLTDKEVSLFRQFQKLATDLLLSDIRYKKEIIGSMVSSAFYMFGSLFSDKLSAARSQENKSSSKSELIFNQFLKLVTEYHTRERRVSFYADKFCLTPKYLSKLIKDVSGRSAPEWIDGYVILEAKNMLKYSDMPIKEIVYRLNFPNQSVFYKFFKSHTGKSPTEYRNL